MCIVRDNATVVRELDKLNQNFIEQEDAEMKDDDDDEDAVENDGDEFNPGAKN